MRKQLARAGVVAVAAMMLTTTAFADGITDVKYTGINEVTVTVPTVAGAETSLLAVTSVEDATAPTVTDGKNIAYVDQDKTDSSVVALAEKATLTFKFNTQGPAAREGNGSVDVFSAYMGGDALASVVKVKEMAPAKSIELTVPSAVTIPAGSNSDAIKAKLAEAKATVTVTHQLDGSEAKGTPITVGSEDDVFTYAIDGTGIKASFDPTTAGAKFETTTKEAVSSAVVDENVTIEAKPIVVTGITLSVDPTSAESNATPVVLRNTSGDNWDNNNDLVIERLQEKVEITASYTVAGDGSKDSAPVTNNAQYVVTGGTGVTGDPYVITVTYKENSGEGGAPVTSNTLKLYAVKGPETLTVAISGKVETRNLMDILDYTATEGAVVTVYDKTTGQLVGAALSGEDGTFSVEVPDADAEYYLRAAYASIFYADGSAMSLVYNSPFYENATSQGFKTADSTFEPIVIQMSYTMGDTNGDGVADGADLAAVKANWNNNFVTMEVQ